MRAVLFAIVFVAASLGSAPAFADKSADSSYKEGLAYKQEGKIDDAIKAFEEAVAANPKHGMAWSSLGSLYKQRKNLPKAIDAYEHATQLITKEAVLWTNLGTAYANVDPPRLDDAIRALSNGIKLDPKNAEAHAFLGTVQRKKGDYAGAVSNLELAVKAQPDNPEWQHNLGVAYRYAKRNEDAIKTLEKAVALNNNEARYHFDLAVTYRRQTTKDPDLISKAIAEYEKATALDPTDAEGWFDLGYMYKENHDNDKAIDAFHHYLDLKKGKDDAGAKRITEDCQALGGDCGKAPGKTPPKKK